MPLPSWLKEGVQVAAPAISALALGLAAVTYCGNGRAERQRWSAQLSVQPQWTDVDLGPDLKFTAPGWSGDLLVHLPLTFPPGTEFPHGPPNPITPVHVRSTLSPASGEGENLVLLVRNASFRPAAIVAVYYRDTAGDPYGAYECGQRLGLPILVDPWRAVRLEVPLVHDVRDNTPTVMVMRDMDDHEAVISLRKHAGMTRIEFRSPSK